MTIGELVPKTGRPEDVLMKSFRAIWAALALSLGLAGAARAEDIVVTHYASLLYGTPYAVALDKGYFKQAGVDVSSILTSKGGGTSVRNMMAGDTLFAEVAFPAALSALKEGFPIKIISGGTAGPSSFWVTRPDDEDRHAGGPQGQALRLQPAQVGEREQHLRRAEVARPQAVAT